MQQYLLLARGIIDVPHAAKAKGPSVRASIEQLARDPTVKATYGVIDNGTVLFALLCEVPAFQEAQQLATMARVYGLPNVEVLPLVLADDLRADLEAVERHAKALAAAAARQHVPELSVQLDYQRAS